VVQLDDLHRVEVARGAGRELHHQHGAEAEVGRDQHAHLGLAGQPVTDEIEALLGEAGRAHDHADALADGPVQVVHDHRGGGEVDKHLSAGVRRVGERVALVDPGDETEVVGPLDGLAHFETHAAPGSENADTKLLILASHRHNLAHPTC
jgi:hypothetical protein